MQSIAKTLKFVISLTFILLCFHSNAQKLKMGDLLKAYSLDSISLKKFLNEKNFHPGTAPDEDDYRVGYTYYADTVANVSIDRTFPKLNKRLVFLYYHFSDQAEYKDLKKSIKANGFKYIRSYKAFPDVPAISDFREQFSNDNLKIELSSSRLGRDKKFVLLIMPE